MANDIRGTVEIMTMHRAVFFAIFKQCEVQGSRGVLLHHHCVALTGHARIHVAVQHLSGLRSMP